MFFYIWQTESQMRNDQEKELELEIQSLGGEAIQCDEHNKKTRWKQR